MCHFLSLGIINTKANLGDEVAVLDNGVGGHLIRLLFLREMIGGLGLFFITGETEKSKTGDTGHH